MEQGFFSRENRGPRWVIAALVLLWGVWAVLNYNLNEDAFISFRYVENLVGGEGLVYNPGVRDEAYSNLLWILLLAVPALFGVPPEAAAAGLGILCGAGILYVAWLIARRALPERRWAPLAAPLMLALWYPLLGWSGSGLETSLYTLLLLLAAYFHLRREPTRFPWTGLFLGAAALTRPEGAAFIVVFAVHHLLYRKRGPGTGSDWRDLATALGLLAAQFLFRRFYYGLWLPLPAYVKAGGSLQQLRQGLGYLVFIFWPTALLLPGLAALWAAIKRLRRPLVGLAVLVLAAQAAFILYAGGDYMGAARFLVPAAPLLMTAAVLGLDEAAGRARRPWLRRLIFWGPAALFVAWSLAADLPAYEWRLGADPARLHNNVKRFSAEWLAAVLPPEATLACGSAGALPYYSGLVNYDFAGLADAEAALHGERCREGPAGHHLAYPELIAEREPWVIVINPNACRAEQLGAWLTGETAAPGLDLDELSHPNRAVLSSPTLAADYRPMFAEVADGCYLTFYARRGAAEERLRAAGACPLAPGVGQP
jgi:hypothetical protein